MPDYKLGKIYAIRSHQTEEIYIGSTTQSLAVRLAKHKGYIKGNIYCSSCEILKYPDAYIELIEPFPCNSKEELNKKEGEHIRANKCVNKQIAGRTKKEQKKEYYDTNKNKILEQQKEYKQANKDKIAEYYDTNKNKILERQKEYNKINKEQIKEYKKQYYLRKKQSS